LYIYNGSYIVNFTPDVVVNNGAFHHVAVSWDGTTAVGTCIIYIDGVPYSTTSTRDATSLGVLSGMFISPTAAPMLCNVSNLRIYNRALTQQEITDIYNAEKGTYGL